MKRQRGRGRKSNGHQPNRNFESNGPDIKIRGSASHVYEKYQQLARDAASAGDRIAAESYLQHAEHYFRVMRSQGLPYQQRDREDGGMREPAAPYGNGRDDGDDFGYEADYASPPLPGYPQPNGHLPHQPHQTLAAPSSGGPLDVVDPEAAEQQPAPQPQPQPQRAQGEREEGGGRSRRPRRQRRRYEGGGEGGSNGAGNGAEPAAASPTPTLDG